MQIPEKCYIQSVVCVVSFKPDADIRHQSGEFEKSFGEITKSQAQATNVPDAFPEEIPRWTLKSANKQIALSKRNIQMNLSFANSTSKKSVNEQFETASKNIELFWKGVCNFRSPEKRGEVGLIFTINLPVEGLSIGQIAAKNFERYSKMPRLGEIAQYNVSVAFQSNGYFKTFTSTAYEMRSLAIDPQGNKRKTVNIADLKPEEIGYEYKFDVNNRPKAEQSGFISSDNDGIQILGELKNLLFNDSAKLIDW